MSNTVSPLTQIALAPVQPRKVVDGGGSSFFEAMAQAWGQALDKQADAIKDASDVINGGDDRPAALTELTTQSLKMNFLSQSSQSSISAVGKALETMARKQ